MPGENTVVNLFIVAGSALVRAELESLLGAKDEFIVTGGAAEISAAPPDFPGGRSVGVILANIEHERELDDWQEFLSESADEAEAPRVVFLIPPELRNANYLLPALQNGVRGLLPPEASLEEIGAALIAAANNLVSLTPEFIESLAASVSAERLPNSIVSPEKEAPANALIESLTARETDILEMLVEGASNKLIAQQLNISEHTVKFHLASIFGKLGVNTRTEAVTEGLRHGLILL